MVTFRLTVPQFQQLLTVILRPEAPDHLTNLVLMACTRPHDGIISVPVPADDASAIRDLVMVAAQDDPQHAGLAALIRGQATIPE
jgi:hypothetical protein